MGRRDKYGDGGSFLPVLAGIVLLIAGAMAVFYAAYKVSYVSVDYGIHLDIVKELDWSDPLQMLRDHPEPVWHLLVRAAMGLGGFSAERAAGLVSGGLCALTYLMAAHFLYRASRPDLAHDQGRLSLPAAALSALVLSLAAAVYVPWFNRTPYLGQGSPNPWHNPTTIMVRPVGLLIFMLVMGECVRVQRAGFRKGQGLRIGKGILLAILLVLSNFSKPSFVQVFYPAIFLLMLLWLFVYRFRNFPFGMQLLVCCLPSAALMGMQFFFAFYSRNETPGGTTEGVMIAPFKVAGLYTDNIAVSTLLVLAFPLFAALCSLIRRTFDWTDAFAWLMLLAGMAEKFLLAEKGTRLWHGNFNWGYILALYFVWFAAIRDYALWGASLRARRGRAGQAAGGGASVLGFVLAGGILALHLVSGIYYLYYLIVLGNGV